MSLQVSRALPSAWCLVLVPTYFSACDYFNIGRYEAFGLALRFTFTLWPRPLVPPRLQAGWEKWKVARKE